MLGQLGGCGRAVLLQVAERSEPDRMRQRTHRLRIGDLEIAVRISERHVSRVISQISPRQPLSPVRVRRDTEGVDDRRADIAALYRQTWPPLIGVLVSIGGSRLDAELVAQDAYARLLGRWDAIRRYEDPEAWVRGAAVRTMVGRLRRREVVPRLAARLIGRPDPMRESAGDVAAALAGITPEQRAVVVLHDVMELPVEQIAVDLELPVGAVNARLARARRALGRVLEHA